MPIIATSVFSLPYRYRLIINLFAVIGWFFGRDERLTAMMMLLNQEIEQVADNDENFDSMVDSVADAIKIEHRMKEEA
jgi:hypothetical protein